MDERDRPAGLSTHTPPPATPPATGVPGLRPPAPADLVRPYARTTGRTRPARHLPLEALVHTRDVAPASELVTRRDQQAIRRLCRTPRSVAEIAAELHIPLGVARVLIADAADLGLVTVHNPRAMPGDRPSLTVMERILHGLRHL